MSDRLTAHQPNPRQASTQAATSAPHKGASSSNRFSRIAGTGSFLPPHRVSNQELVERLAREQVALTVCPLSNVKLCVVPTLTEHNFKRLLDAGLKLTINSDDPAYFGGYIAQNYLETAQALGLTRAELKRVAGNSLEASFVPESLRAPWLARLAAMPG